MTPIKWTPEEDSVLRSKVEQASLEDTWADITQSVNEQLDGVFTEDSVRNRARRIGVERPKPPATTEMFAIPAATGDYVGFRTLYVDLETTNLGAIMGRILCASFCDEFGNVETYRLNDPKYAGSSIIDDSKLAVAIRDRIEAADVIVGHNFKLFDKPFLNARLLKAGNRPVKPDCWIVDTLFLAGGSNLRLGSRKLDNIAKFLRLGEQKTVIDWDTWSLAGTGDAAAMAQVVEHCEADVLVERDAFAYLRPFVAGIHR